MKVLWLTPKWTLPANDGARVASRQLLKYLPKDKMDIDYFAFSHPEDDEDREALIKSLGVNKASFIKRDLPLTLGQKIIYYFFAFLREPLLPLTMSTFRSSKIMSGMREHLKHNDYDYIVADGLHCIAPFFEEVDKLPVIYRAHNVETDIWKRAAGDTLNPLKKLFLNFQHKRVKRFENYIIQHAKKVFPISEDDAEVFKKLNTANIQAVIPIGMNFNDKSSAPKEEKNQFLFLGRLDWPPNKDGLKWFLEEVYPKVDHSKSHLHIAGSGDKKWLDSYRHLEGITFHGYVKDVGELYEQVDCSLIPIFYGSGTRIKVIEACSLGKPVISSEMGALGSTLGPDVEYKKCETSEEWVEALNNYNRDQYLEYAQRATKKLSARFEQSAVSQLFYESL